jgi:copper chaperone CopZ
VKGVEGVADVTIQLKKKKVEVVLEKEVADEVLIAAIVDAGYEAEKLK